MKYLLGAGVIGPFPYVDLSPSEFEELRRWRSILLITQGIEEKFGLVLENFWELEETRLRLALRTTEMMTGHDPFWYGVFLLNRRLVNLLTTCRMYVDQTVADFGRLSDDPDPTRIKKLFSRQYDSLLGFRVMETLRNYAQHQSFPITSAQYYSGWEKFGDQDLLSFRANPRIRIEDLEKSSFKKEVLEELKERKYEEVDLTLLIREYIEGLSTVHSELRTIEEPLVTSAKMALKSALKRYSEASDRAVSPCVAFKLNDEGDETETFRVYSELSERVDKLRARRLPLNVSRWIVTNKAG